METYTNVTRFCLICNYVSRIIEPIASRCAKFRFKPLRADVAKQTVASVASKENIAVTDAVLDELIKVSGGDLRRAITLLQSTSHLGEEAVTPQMIYEVSGVMPEDAIDPLIGACLSKSMGKVADQVTMVINNGFAATQVLTQLHEWLVTTDKLPDANKARVAMAFAHADMCLADGADEYLQLLNVAAAIVQQAV